MRRREIFVGLILIGLLLLGKVVFAQPSPPKWVNDGLGADEDVTTSITQLSANWPEPIENFTKPIEYLYAIGTTRGGTDTVDWTPSGFTSQQEPKRWVTHTNLKLTNGQTYYFAIKAIYVDYVESVPTYSDGIRVNIATVNQQYPSPPKWVNDGLGADEDVTTSITQLSANWPEAIWNSTKPIEYLYAIGTTRGGTDIVDWKSSGFTPQQEPKRWVTHTNLRLSNGKTYYFAVKARYYVNPEEGTVGSTVTIQGTVDSVPTYSDGIRVDIASVKLKATPSPSSPLTFASGESSKSITYILEAIGPVGVNLNLERVTYRCKNRIIKQETHILSKTILPGRQLKLTRNIIVDETKRAQVLSGRDRGTLSITYEFSGYDANSNPISVKVPPVIAQVIPLPPEVFRVTGIEISLPKRVRMGEDVRGKLKFTTVGPLGEVKGSLYIDDVRWQSLSVKGVRNGDVVETPPLPTSVLGSHRLTLLLDKPKKNEKVVATYEVISEDVVELAEGEEEGLELTEEEEEELESTEEEEEGLESTEEEEEEGLELTEEEEEELELTEEEEEGLELTEEEEEELESTEEEEFEELAEEPQWYEFEEYETPSEEEFIDYSGNIDFGGEWVDNTLGERETRVRNVSSVINFTKAVGSEGSLKGNLQVNRQGMTTGREEGIKGNLGFKKPDWEISLSSELADDSNIVSNIDYKNKRDSIRAELKLNMIKFLPLRLVYSNSSNKNLEAGTTTQHTKAEGINLLFKNRIGKIQTKLFLNSEETSDVLEDSKVESLSYGLNSTIPLTNRFKINLSVSPSERKSIPNDRSKKVKSTFLNSTIESNLQASDKLEFNASFGLNKSEYESQGIKRKTNVSSQNYGALYKPFEWFSFDTKYNFSDTKDANSLEEANINISLTPDVDKVKLFKQASLSHQTNKIKDKVGKLLSETTSSSINSSFSLFKDMNLSEEFTTSIQNNYTSAGVKEKTTDNIKITLSHQLSEPLSYGLSYDISESKTEENSEDTTTNYSGNVDLDYKLRIGEREILLSFNQILIYSNSNGQKVDTFETNVGFEIPITHLLSTSYSYNINKAKTKTNGDTTNEETTQQTIGLSLRGEKKPYTLETKLILIDSNGNTSQSITGSFSYPILEKLSFNLGFTQNKNDTTTSNLNAGLSYTF